MIRQFKPQRLSRFNLRFHDFSSAAGSWFIDHHHHHQFLDMDQWKELSYEITLTGPFVSESLALFVESNLKPHDHHWFIFQSNNCLFGIFSLLQVTQKPSGLTTVKPHCVFLQTVSRFTFGCPLTRLRPHVLWPHHGPAHTAEGRSLLFHAVHGRIHHHRYSSFI